MRYLLLLVIILISQSCSEKKDLVDMTSKDWVDDISYLEKKIDKEFKSFLPGVKDQFLTEINQLKNRVPDLESYEISCEIMRLLSILGDGHTELNIAQSRVGLHRLPFQMYFFEGELHILAAHSDFKDYLGARITSWGKYTISEAFEKLTRTMSHDNEYEFIHAGPSYLILT